MTRPELVEFARAVVRPVGMIVRGWIGGVLVTAAVLAGIAGAWSTLAAFLATAALLAAWIVDDLLTDYRTRRTDP